MKSRWRLYKGSTKALWSLYEGSTKALLRLYSRSTKALSRERRTEWTSYIRDTTWQTKSEVTGERLFGWAFFFSLFFNEIFFLAELPPGDSITRANFEPLWLTMGTIRLKPHTQIARLVPVVIEVHVLIDLLSIYSSIYLPIYIYVYVYVYVCVYLYVCIYITPGIQNANSSPRPCRCRGECESKKLD
jgi:hypothetical protein